MSGSSPPGEDPRSIIHLGFTWPEPLVGRSTRRYRETLGLPILRPIDCVLHAGPPWGVASLALIALAGSGIGQGNGCGWDVETDGPIPRIEAPGRVVAAKLYLLGGFHTGTLAATTEVDVYDPATGAWTPGAAMPAAVTHAGVAVDEPRIWLAGGFLGDHPGPVVDDVWVYDTSTDSWSSGPPLPVPRASGAMARLERELHFFGGVSSDRDTDQAEHWVLDLDNPVAWTPAAPLPVPRNHLCAATVGGRVYALGGQLRHDTNPADVAFVHAWDPDTGSWSQVASLPFGRSHFEPGTFVWNEQIVIAGGRANGSGHQALADVTAYDPASDTWRALPALPGNLLAPAAVLLEDRFFVTGGGTDAFSPLRASFSRPANDTFPHEVRTNSGGDGLSLAQAWCPDGGFVGGQSFENPQIANIAGTGNDELYRSERSGTSAVPDHFRYAIPVAGGDYHVRLHFAEIFWGAPGGGPGGTGRRVFDVSIEGTPVLTDFDINAEVGPMTATLRGFDVAVDDGVLDIEFQASVDRPKVSGIEVIALEPASNYCGTTPNSAGPGASISYSGTRSVLVDDFTLEASGCPSGQTALFLQGAAQGQTPLGNGVLCLDLPSGFFRLVPPLQTDAAGGGSRRLDLRHPIQPAAKILPGSTWNFQLWFRDGPGVTNLSDGLNVTFVL